MILLRTFIVSLLAIGVAAAAPAGAQNEGAAYKIGIVDIKEVFDNYDKGHAVYAQLEKDAEANQAKVDALQQQIDKDKERYHANRDSMSEADRIALEDQINEDSVDLQAQFNKLQGEIDLKEKRALEELFEDIQKSVSEIGASGNYHLVLEAGKSNSSGVLYFSTTLNITQRVIEHLNTQYKNAKK